MEEETRFCYFKSKLYFIIYIDIMILKCFYFFMCFYWYYDFIYFYLHYIIFFKDMHVPSVLIL